MLLFLEGRKKESGSDWLHPLQLLGIDCDLLPFSVMSLSFYSENSGSHQQCVYMFLCVCVCVCVGVCDVYAVIFRDLTVDRAKGIYLFHCKWTGVQDVMPSKTRQSPLPCNVCSSGMSSESHMNACLITKRVTYCEEQQSGSRRKVKWFRASKDDGNPQA